MWKFIKLFLRLSIAAGFLSAVADRWGIWSPNVSAWGNWDNFVAYTTVLNPWFNDSMVAVMAILATTAEVVLGLFLFFGFQTQKSAVLSGFLLLVFGLSMTYALGVKAPLDYSVFAASAAAFALSTMKEKFLEVDMLFFKKHSS